MRKKRKRRDPVMKTLTINLELDLLIEIETIKNT